jgi:hypothetical protein
MMFVGQLFHRLEGAFLGINGSENFSAALHRYLCRTLPSAPRSPSVVSIKRSREWYIYVSAPRMGASGKHDYMA